MPDTAMSNSAIIARYREQTPTSEKLAGEARRVLPSGITHDSRHLQPYGIYVERAKGPAKWDADGNEYVDYFGGHGALLLGHNNDTVIAAAHAALDKGTHFGSSHEMELRWAELVTRLVPSAEKVRFTSSGTEATHMALRLARAYNGKRKVARFLTHFHGWHDHMTSGYTSHYDGSPTIGVLREVAESVVLLPPGDEVAMREAFANDPDIAAVIVEPTGSTFGLVPLKPEFLQAMREAASEHGIVLIFDEVVTGFRVSPGGAQGAIGVTPDLTTMAKIIAGGLPGGAVGGKAEILDFLDFEVSGERGREKIAHPGTYNANPVSAAAGVAALTIIGETDACARANATGQKLRDSMNELFEAEGLPWASYGTYSGFHIFTNPEGRDITPATFDPYEIDYMELKSKPKGLMQKIRLGMLCHGVDITGWPGGTISATHGDAEVTKTRDAFAATIAMLRREGEI